MDIALHGREHDLAVRPSRALGLCRLDVGDEVGDRLLHHARALHHLGEEHLPGAEQVANDVHAVHQRAFDDLDRLFDLQPEFLDIIDDELVDTVDECVGDAFSHGGAAPLRGDCLHGRPGVAVVLRDLQQSLGGVRATVEDHVLHPHPQVLGNVVVHG